MGRRSFKKKIKKSSEKSSKKNSKKGRLRVRQKGSNDSIAEYCIMAKVRRGGEGRGGKVENCHSNA
jgi:hypothetical protein